MDTVPDILKVSILGRESIHCGFHLIPYIARTVLTTLPASVYVLVTDTNVAQFYLSAFEKAFSAEINKVCVLSILCISCICLVFQSDSHFSFLPPNRVSSPVLSYLERRQSLVKERPISKTFSFSSAALVTPSSSLLVEVSLVILLVLLLRPCE